MKGLSIRAPWWWWIVNGQPHKGKPFKDIENRVWRTDYRGTILVHASATWKPREVMADHFEACSMANQPPGIGESDHDVARMKAIGGRFVGQVDIIDCVTHSNSPWFVGPFGFVLANPIAFLNPVPGKARLGLFNVDSEIMEAVTYGQSKV